MPVRLYVAYQYARASFSIRQNCKHRNSSIKNKKKREDDSNYTQQEEKVIKEKVGSFKNLNNVSKFKSLIKEGP